VIQLPTKLWSLTATEVLSLINKDRLTVEDYAKALVGRIESRKSVAKAWNYFGDLTSSLNANRARHILAPIQTLS